jgi:tRNA 5-methylaminomethyl-2-thiouridine biosynthesis bifunctional protein
MGEQPAYNSNTNPSILPAHPINGNGGLIPHLPTQSGTAWVFGATYEASNPEPLNVDQHVQANQSKLAALLPELAGLMAGHLQTNTLAHWQGERCVTADRFPLLGPLDEAQTLWLCTGLGSRGLSFAALCAEQLAAQWHQEPAPLRTDLAKFVALDRLFRTK